MLEKIKWLGHASFKISGEKVIYIDPWKLDHGDEADIILVSHSHYDHYSQGDIDRVRGPNCVVVCVKELESKIGGRVETVAPGDKVDVDGVMVEAVPAYNIDKDFHPRANGWVGFVVEMSGERLYYAGDTDKIPEMEDLKDIDVALLPIGGTYTMDAREAAEAANGINPKIAIPYHWGDIVGSASDAQDFADAFKGRTEILKPGR